MDCFLLSSLFFCQLVHVHVGFRRVVGSPMDQSVPIDPSNLRPQQLLRPSPRTTSSRSDFVTYGPTANRLESNGTRIVRWKNANSVAFILRAHRFVGVNRVTGGHPTNSKTRKNRLQAVEAARAKSVRRTLSLFFLFRLLWTGWIGRRSTFHQFVRVATLHRFTDTVEPKPEGNDEWK